MPHAATQQKRRLHIWNIIYQGPLDACDDKSQLCDTKSQLKERAREDLMVSSTNAAVTFVQSFRWLQLAMGIVCMAMIANLQYGWTLFVDPIDAKYHWGRAAIQLAFTIFVVTETWLVPIEAWFVDKYGPRRRHHVRRRDDRALLGAQLLCGLADAALCRRGRRRHRRRRGVRHLRRQRAEMVSGPPRPCRRRHRRRLRRGRRDHRGADRDHDRRERLSGGVPQLRHRRRA